MDPGLLENPRRRVNQPGSTWTFWLVAVYGGVVFAALGSYPFVNRPLHSLLEAVLFLSVTGLVLLRFPVRSFFRAMPLRAGIVLAAILIFSFAGQVRHADKENYPFVSWTMYGTTAPAPFYTAYQATFESGETGPFPFTTVSPSTSPRAFIRGLTTREDDWEAFRIVLRTYNARIDDARQNTDGQGFLPTRVTEGRDPMWRSGATSSGKGRIVALSIYNCGIDVRAISEGPRCLHLHTIEDSQ